MRGRAPKPKAVKDLIGDRHRKRRARTSPGELPVADLDAIAPPPWLSEPATLEYRRVLDLLKRTGTVTESDRSALSQYAIAYDQYQRATEACSSVPLVSADGRTSGAFRVWKDAAQELRRAQQELGLTPLSRQRLPVAVEPVPQALAPRER